jgi:hypothetical protein
MVLDLWACRWLVFTPVGGSGGRLVLGLLLPLIWWLSSVAAEATVEMRLFCGVACGRLKMRELGWSAVGRSCRCWRLAKGEKAGSVERKVCVQRVTAVVWR